MLVSTSMAQFEMCKFPPNATETKNETCLIATSFCCDAMNTSECCIAPLQHCVFGVGCFYYTQSSSPTPSNYPTPSSYPTQSNFPTPSNYPTRSNYPTPSNYPTRPPIVIVKIEDYLSNKTIQISGINGSIVIDSKVVISQNVIAQSNLILTNRSILRFVEPKPIQVNGTINIGGLIEIFLESPPNGTIEIPLFDSSDNITVEDHNILITETYQETGCQSVDSQSKLSSNARSFSVLISPTTTKCSKKKDSFSDTDLAITVTIVSVCVIVTGCVSVAILIMLFIKYVTPFSSLFNTISDEDKQLSKELRQSRKAQTRHTSVSIDYSPKSSQSDPPV
jgi:hypothetical protein